MNIVILTIILPYPLDSGGAQAQYNMIDRLRFNHNITIVFPENEMNKMSAIDELKKRWPQVEFCPYRYANQLINPCFLFSKIKRAFKKTVMPNNERFIVERMLTPYGYSMDWRFVRFFNNVIKEKAADIVQIEFYPYLHFVNKLPAGIRKIFIHHEIRYIRNRRLLADINLKPSEKAYMEQLYRQEIEDLNKYDAVVALTEIDKKELLDNGVEVPLYASPASINSELLEYENWNGKITFLGGYGHTPNQEGFEWLVKSVVPLVDWSKYPNTEIQIVGRGWPQTVESLTNLVKIKRMGFVKNLTSVAKNSIMIVPILSGSGMRMKILEGAAMGMPIITTAVGVEGIDFEHKKSCMKVNSAEDFAESLMQVMSNQNLRIQLTTEARKKFIEKYSIDATAKIRENIYCSLNNDRK